MKDLILLSFLVASCLASPVPDCSEDIKTELKLIPDVKNIVQGDAAEPISLNIEQDPNDKSSAKIGLLNFLLNKQVQYIQNLLSIITTTPAPTTTVITTTPTTTASTTPATTATTPATTAATTPATTAATTPATTASTTPATTAATTVSTTMMG